MKSQVIPIKMSNLTMAHLIKAADGYLLIDTDDPGKLETLRTELASLDIALHEIKYLLLTHNHVDHTGSVSELQQELPNLTLIYHKNAIPYLTTGDYEDLSKNPHYSSKLWLTLFLKVVSRAFAKKYPPITTNSEKDIIIDDENRTFLKSIGIDGKIIATPGHTEDSISVVLDTGEAVVGDLCWTSFNRPLPALFKNWKDVVSSLEKLLNSGATKIYCSHKGILSDRDLHKGLTGKVRQYRI